jgi:STE24 endopeptidase
MLGFAIVWLAQLPFGVLALWWERRYGVSTLGYATWVFQNWFGLGSRFLFICLAILIVMGAAKLAPRRWWLIGAPVFVSLGLLEAFVQPYLIPMVHPLRDSATAADLRRLERAESLPPINVVVQDVHEFTTAPNAEAAGFGPTRRIILWDTLLDGRFSEPQVRVVLAHELGHLARNHILKDIGWYGLLALPEAFLIAVAVRRRGGMVEPAAVPVALFVFVVVQFAALPVQKLISRHREAEADWIALQATRDPTAARALFRGLAVTSHADPSPPGWAYVLFEDHPTIAQRIAMIEAWKRREAQETRAATGGVAATTSATIR